MRLKGNLQLVIAILVIALAILGALCPTEAFTSGPEVGGQAQQGELVSNDDYPDLAIIRVQPKDVFDAGTQRIQPTSVGKIFYQFFSDRYDFLVVYPLFVHEDDDHSYYVQAQNHVRGIGLNDRDLSSWFGSQGKLLGVAFANPTTNASLVLHEIGHQWCCYARFCQDGGSLSEELFRFWQYAPYHWMLVNYGAYGIMGGIGWSDNGDGTFTAAPAPTERSYLPLSLYVMGLVPAADVVTIPLLALDGAPDWWQPGDVVAAHESAISIEDVICAEGARTPSVPESQKHFRAAFVVLTMDEEMPAGLDGLESVRQQVPGEFSRATGGKATMDTSLGAASPGEQLLCLPLVIGS